MHIMLKDFPKDLTLVIALTLACILFVLAPRLNETPVQIIIGLLLVLFLPGYSLIAALFPGKDDLDGIERIALRFLGPGHRSRAAARVFCSIMGDE